MLRRVFKRFPARLINTTPIQTTSIFDALDTFDRRHLGPNDRQVSEMCGTLGVSNLDELVDVTIPKSIHIKKPTRLGKALTESETLALIKQIAAKNVVNRSYIGLGYYSAITPPVILRNVMENPGWYTQYTPYQPEIAQGRLESLVNYQTMVSDMTGLDVANASLLDEGTAAAEAMMLSFAVANRKRNVFFVDSNCFPQTIECIKTRAEGFGIQVVVGDYRKIDYAAHPTGIFGILIQYPNINGDVIDYKQVCDEAHQQNALVSCATDLLALALLKPPGEFGADIALGNSQRFGVPLGYGI